MRRAPILLVVGLAPGLLAACSDSTPAAAPVPQSVNRVDPAVTTFAITLVEREPEYLGLLAEWGECGGGEACIPEGVAFAEWANEVRTEIRTADINTLPSQVRDLATQTSLALGAVADAVESDDPVAARAAFDELEADFETWNGYLS